MSGIGAKKRFEVLDGMRGVAALLVMIYHYTLSPKILFINANIAVDVFFILSGFVLFYSYADRLANDMSPGEYIWRRIIRLYPLFFLGLFLGEAVSAFHALVDGAPFPCKNILGSFVLNMFFIPCLDIGNPAGENFRHLIFPANTSLWSLFFEMSASLIFPFLVRLKPARLAGFSASCFAAIVVGAIAVKLFGLTPHLDYNVGWNTSTFLRGFPRVFYGFSLGIVIARFVGAHEAHPLCRIIENIKYKSLLVYLALAIVLLLPLSIKYTYYLWSIGLAAPGIVTVGAMATCENRVISSVSRFLGWLSYPIYCLHVPVYDGLTLIYRKNNLAGVPLLLTSIIVTTALSIIVTKFYDEPARAFLTRKLRRYVGSSLTASVPGNEDALNERRPAIDLLNQQAP